MKFATIIFSILLFLNGILLMFQFHVFSNNADDEDRAFSYTQNIEATYKGNAIYVEQTFSELPKKKLTLEWPEASKKKACGLDDKGASDQTTCASLEENLSTFTKGEKKAQTISYKIPVSKKGLKSGELLNDVFASVKHGIVSHTKLQIIDENKKEGQWLSGLPKIGEQHLQNVDYAYFRGSGAVYELYWTEKVKKKAFDSDELTVYTKQNTKTDLKNTVSEVKTLNTGHVDVVETSQNKSNGSRIIFTKTLNSNSIQQKVVMSQIKEKYQLNNSNKDIPNVLASFATNSLMGNAKSKEMVQTLNDYFNTNQRVEWQDGLEDLSGKKVNSSVLDELLSGVLDAKTSYFQLNEASDKTTVPLMFEEKRALYVNGQKTDDVKIILKDGEILYSANPLLSKLGYRTSIGKNGYYVKSNYRSLRFPAEKYDFYVINDERVNFNGLRPVVNIAGTYYIEESWLLRIFRLDYAKHENKIELNEQK